jgi:hypothetical protein
VTDETIALHWLVQFLVDDVSILDLEAVQTLLRRCVERPLIWLWFEQQLHRHGLSPSLVWGVIFPDTARSSTPGSTLATRLPRRVSPTLRTTL